jgi:nitroimidazol reductase NimA-like FMN-containing flavoprotein (pyridoxamine 5'-phosphate oxidase superfamily)
MFEKFGTEKNDPVLNSEEIESVLHNQVVGRLGCHADGLTYVIPISYAYDGEYLYCHTYEGKKINILRKNPKLCFQVDEMRNMANWKSVIVWGNFEELTRIEEKNKALQALLNRSLPIHSSITTHLGAQWPFSSEDLNEIPGIFFRVRMHDKTGRFEKNGVSPMMPG